MATNTVVFCGRLASAPIMRRTQDGRNVANMLVINSRSSGYGTDNYREYSDAMQVVAFDAQNEDVFQQAKWCGEVLRQGDEVTIDGRLQVGEYTPQGSNRPIKTVEIIASFVHRNTSEEESLRLQDRREARYAAEDEAQSDDAKDVAEREEQVALPVT